MKQFFIRTVLNVPGVGSLINIAELSEIDSKTCQLHRMIELNPNNAIVGAWANGQSHGQINPPQKQVPHPDTYTNFPDIEYSMLKETEFEALWEEAAATLGI